MFNSLNIDSNFKEFYRKLSGNKSIKVLAKIDGVNWYDISHYVKKTTINNKIQLLNSPTIDSAKIEVKNENNAFTSTVYNDVFDPVNGKINGTIDDDYLNKTWEIKIYTTATNLTSSIDIPIFHGWKPAKSITEKNKYAEIELKDLLWITTQNRLKNPLLYTSMTPSEIISDILNRCGLDANYQDLQTLNINIEAFIAAQGQTYWQIIQKICEGTSGIISTSPEGKVIYRTRVESFDEPLPFLTITQEHFKKYELQKKEKYNQLKVESEGYEIGATATDYLIDTELTGDKSIIKAGDTRNFELKYISDFGKDFASTVFITVKNGETIVDNLGAFSAGDSDGFIRVNKITAYPDKLVLNITNLASAADYTLAQVQFKGRKIKKISLNSVEELNTSSQPDSEISIKSFYGDESVLSNILDVLKFNTNKEIVFRLEMNEFYPDIFAGNLITFEIPIKGIGSGIFIVEQVKQILNDDLSYNTELLISEWRDIVFNINNKEIYKSTPAEVITKSPEQSKIDEIGGEVGNLEEDMQEQKSKTSYLDGAAPSVPTGFLLSTEELNKESVLKVVFNNNTETDILGYEIAYSQDGIKWKYNTVKENSAFIQVIANTKYYVKLRAYDAEGNNSPWTATKSITSAKDSTPPAKPTGLVATALFQKVKIDWNNNTEEDLKGYILQASEHSDFSVIKDEIFLYSNYIAYSGGINTTFYFRIKAVDTSGNESDFSEVVNATTAAIYDSELESSILNQLDTDMETLNNTTLPEMQSDIDSKLENAPGVITETLIGDNSISTAKIKTNAVTANEIASEAITTDKIAANSITSSKIGTNQIITNTANIASSIIQTAHIKDAAIENAKIKDGAITNAKVGNAEIDDAKIANIDAAKIITGYIDSDRIEAGTITSDKLIARPAFSIPEGAIAYFTDSLIDHVSGITPEGYDEINLSPKITLLPENAPPGSVVANLMAADKIYANHLSVALELTGHTISGAELKSNLLLSDNSTPVSYFNLDDGTFKIGDDVSATKKYISYNGANLEIVGGTLKLKNEDDSIQFLNSGFSTLDTSARPEEWFGDKSLSIYSGDPSTNLYNYTLFQIRRDESDANTYAWYEHNITNNTRLRNPGEHFWQVDRFIDYNVRLDNSINLVRPDIIDLEQLLYIDKRMDRYQTGEKIQYTTRYNDAGQVQSQSYTHSIVDSINTANSYHFTKEGTDQTSSYFSGLYIKDNIFDRWERPSINEGFLGLNVDVGIDGRSLYNSTLYLGYRNTDNFFRNGLIIDQNYVKRRFPDVDQYSTLTGYVSTYIEIDMDTTYTRSSTFSSEILNDLNTGRSSGRNTHVYPIGTWSKVKYRTEDGSGIITNEYGIYIKTENTGGWIEVQFYK